MPGTPRRHKPPRSFILGLTAVMMACSLLPGAGGDLAATETAVAARVMTQLAPAQTPGSQLQTPNPPPLGTPLAPPMSAPGQPPMGAPGQPPMGAPGQPPGNTISVIATDSEYPIASGGLSGWFTTGQPADIVLSAVDFNNTGGPLLFNHPGAVASDGTRLLLADRNNNRVLIWNSLPTGNTPPDLVLGQPDFTANNPGAGPDQMNWPVAVSAADGKVVVADTYNDRILIWNSFPTVNAQPADLILQTPAQPNPAAPPIQWPWGVWTDGTKLAATSTRGGRVHLWHTFPTRDDQPPDVILTAQGQMGTPRGITSNGEYLIVADHNARLGETAPGSPLSGPATFVWTTWPTSDQPYDFTLEGWRTGTFTPEGRLILLSTTHHPPSIWNEPPATADDAPDLELGQTGPGMGGGYRFFTGDGSSAAWAGGRLYLSLSNGNMIVAYNSMPVSADQLPDFAIGSPDINTNTLEANFIISNPVVAADGQSLFVSSDFDRKLYVWKSLPNRSGAHPDFVYTLPEPAWDNELYGGTLALAGGQAVYIWSQPPRNGELPDLTLSGNTGGVPAGSFTGVALDDRYFYLASAQSNAIYVWEGIPAQDSQPKFTLTVEGAGRLSSDGAYLATTGVAGPGGSVIIFRVDQLSAGGAPVALGGPGKFNLPGGVLVSRGHLFVADTVFNRVQIWTNIADALAGKDPDVILGANDLTDVSAEIGQDKLFWPATLAFDGSYLWVGEFKFSERLLRFSVR